MIKRIANSDKGLMIVSLILLLSGLIMVLSSSGIIVEQSAFKYFFKQVMWAIISFVLFAVFLSLDYKHLRKWPLRLLIICFVLLIAVFLFGKSINGAKRWLNLGVLNFQPSEMVKLSLILALADYLDKNKSKLMQISGLAPCIGIIILFCALIAAQPDLGVPAVIMAVSLILLYIAGANKLYLSVVVAAAIAAIAAGIITMPYRMKRLLAFLDPWNDSSGAGYQLIQSLLSLGSGGIFGKGLGQGEFKRYYLPAQHTDFIFSIIGEEFGLFGGLFIIVMFTLFLYIGYKIARNAPDLFGSLLAMGITLLIVVQAYFNIAVCCGFVPTKGISLPFISYGGTSLMFTSISVGILANISQQKISNYQKMQFSRARF